MVDSARPGSNQCQIEKVFADIDARDRYGRAKAQTLETYAP